MEAVLTQLGLNAKEAKFYLFLIEKGSMTAAQLATGLGESRTNAYMVLERLAEDKLVVVDDTTAIRTYTPASPDTLKALVANRQLQLRQANLALHSILPELSSQYNLGQHTPGVVYFEGLKGYKAFQEDSTRTGLPIDVLASNAVPENKEAEKVLKEMAKKRANDSRIIFHMPAKKWLDVADFESRGYEVRFWGKEPLLGEVAIYGNKVGMTAYQPALITTVITNEVIAATFKVIFEQLWASAEVAR